MTARELHDLLSKIFVNHPEAEKGDVWFYNEEGTGRGVHYVGYDTKHKPNRIKLEE